MTREEAIEEVNKAFEPAFANYIITALTEGATVSDKALEQEPVLDKIRAEIEGWQEDIHDNEQDAEKYDFVFEPIYEIIDRYRAESEGKQ